MRISASFIIFASMLAASGCAIGNPGYLDDYATVGGKWQRSDPTYGRVGSVFSDPDASGRSGATMHVSDMEGDSNSYYEGDYEVIESYDSGVADQSYPDEFYEEESAVPEVPPYGDGVIILGEDW